jgi:hypothetical protein
MPIGARLVTATSGDGRSGDPPSLQAIAQPRPSINTVATSGLERKGSMGAEELIVARRLMTNLFTCARDERRYWSVTESGGLAQAYRLSRIESI